MLFKNVKSAVNELRNELSQPAYSGCENPKAAAETAGQIVWLCQTEGANRFDWQATGVALAPFFRDEETFRLFRQTVAMLCMERLIMAAAKRRSPNGFYAIDEDAEQEARLAVYKAASQFDGREGASFTTYVNSLLPRTVYRCQLQNRVIPIPEDLLRVVNPRGKQEDLREQAKQMRTIYSLSDPDVNGTPVGDSVIDRSASPVDDVGAAESIRSLTTGVAIVYGAEYVPVLDDQLSHRADEAEARWTAVARRMMTIKTFHNALTESADNFGCDAADAHRISVLYVTNTAALQRWLDRQPESMREWVSAAKAVGITDDEAVSTRSIRDYRNSLFGPLVVGKADPQDLARRAALVAYLRDSGEDALASRFENLVSEG